MAEAGNFWKGRRVFLTGHTGFKGSWLSLLLLDQGAVVRGYSLEPPTKPSLFETLRLARDLDHVIGDIRDRENLVRSIKEFRPEAVFHLAAQPIVRLSYADPVTTYETNVMGTVYLLEALRRAESARAAVIVTSDKCYENREWLWGYREDDSMGGFDPYSSSKGCAEIAVAAWRRSYFAEPEALSVATARAGNVIGGGDWAVDRLVPDCARWLSRNEQIVIRNPRAIRPWQHVLEPVSAYCTLAERLFHQGAAFAEAWNFGPGDRGVAEVETIVKLCIHGWGAGSYRIDGSPQPQEAKILKLDISKAVARLSFMPCYAVEKALEKTMEWYHEFYAGQTDMKDFTLVQMREFAADRAALMKNSY